MRVVSSRLGWQPSGCKAPEESYLYGNWCCPRLMLILTTDARYHPLLSEIRDTLDGTSCEFLVLHSNKMSITIYVA